MAKKEKVFGYLLGIVTKQLANLIILANNLYKTQFNNTKGNSYINTSHLKLDKVENNFRAYNANHQKTKLNRTTAKDVNTKE